MSLREATERPWERALEAGRVWGPERGGQGSVRQEYRPSDIRVPLALNGHQQFPSPRTHRGCSPSDKKMETVEWTGNGSIVFSGTNRLPFWRGDMRSSGA